MVSEIFELPLEEWHPVPSHPEIEASSHGRVRIVPFVGTMPHGGKRVYGGGGRFGCITSASKTSRHLYFSFMFRRKNIKVHFAVCEAFHGKKPAWCKGVRHRNENSLDNRPSNLMWDTHVANMNDPKLKVWHCIREPPRHASRMSPMEKRAGIFESIKDIGYLQRSLRAANDNLATQEAASAHASK